MPADPSATTTAAHVETGGQSGDCDDCGRPFAIVAADGRQPAICAPCFDGYLSGIETAFLENYARFGAKAQRVVAEALLRELVLAPPDDRKVMGMRIVEEYLHAVGDLVGLYTALRQRERVPVLWTFMAHQLDAASLATFVAEVQGRLPEQVLRGIGLPTPEEIESAKAEFSKRDYKQCRAAVRSVVAGLQRATRAEQSVLLRLADGLRASRTLTSAGLPDRGLEPDQVALLVLERKRRVVATHTLNIDERQLERFALATGEMAQAASDMIWLHLRMREV